MDKSKFKPTTARFASTSKEEIQKILIEKDKKNTQRSTNTALRKFAVYLARETLGEEKDIQTEDLPTILEQYSADVRTTDKETKEETYFKTSSFKVLGLGLNRHFCNTRQLDIVKDQRFMRANMIFDGMQVVAKKAGRGTTDSTLVISDEDLQKIGCYFEVDHVNNPDPRILQQTVLFYILYFFCRRGQENLYDMEKDNFKVVVNYDGSKHVEQSKDEMDKNHGVQDDKIANQGKMYEQPDWSQCPVALFKLYVSKLNPGFKKLWQNARRGKLFYSDASWYEKRPIGHDPLERFMKLLSKSINLSSDKYTNHSMRATCISRLDRSGFEACHITALSSHKNESTIKTYSVKCPEEKKREMFNALAAGIKPKKQKNKKTETVAKKPRFNFKKVASNANVTVTNNDTNTTIDYNVLKDLANIDNIDNNDPKPGQNDTVDLPPNFQLIPIGNSDQDDQDIIDYLDQNDHLLSGLVPQQTTTLANTTNTMSSNTMPIMPKMYFPNSSVTINYNFSK